MQPIEIRFATSTEEVRQGLDLYCSSFPGGYEENHQITRNKSQTISDDYLPGRAIVAKRGDRVVGFLRYSVRQIRLGVVVFDILGIGDYCIDKSETEEPFFGIRFLGSCMSILRTLDFPLAIGSGRRIMESYYSRFGFVTASTYAKCWIEKVPPRVLSVLNARCEIRCSESRIAAYENARLATARSDWGVIYRSKPQWQWIIFQAARMRRFDIVEILADDVFIGYFVVGKEGVLDFGFQPEAYAVCCAAMVTELGRRNRASGDAMVLPASFQHPIVSHLRGLHFRFEHRCIPDEGIMAVALNPAILLGTLVNISGVPLDQVRGDLLGSHRALASPNELTQTELRTMVNAMFMGTASPFSVGDRRSNILPPTFYRMNDLDAL